MNSSEIRQAFLDFFARQGHQVVPSSPLIPANDPTLLFTNAGMVQFKDTFLGTESRSYHRAVSAQRCVRAGGKHNDLENVGYTARHHTCFEMLGNFSFGDYFKREAIRYAWDFLTQVLQLPKARLWVTVYLDDDEAADIWINEIGVPADRISRCGEKDNFWSMGDTGPCGPCTEIFYDHGPDIAGGPPGSPEADGDRYIEIWNLVFMQYNRDKQGKLHPLPKPSVDTGMGLERIAAVVQGVHNNYDTDIFQHLIKAIMALKPGLSGQETSLKVIADHIRAVSFLIADGVIPSNEGRGYVLRRIIRRAIRHGHKLALPDPFMAKLVQPLVAIMGTAYPELTTQAAMIERILLQEENQFNRTLEQGLNLLQEKIQGLKDKQIPGDLAFKLYDTYGFPLDLTADIAREQGLTIDMDGFNRHMQQQREQSQAASQFQVDYHALGNLDTCTEFKGYDHDHGRAQVEGLLYEGQLVDSLEAGQQGGVILNETPFYAESGGQVGDRGELRADGLLFEVMDTQKQGQAIIHYGLVKQGSLKKGLNLEARIDANRRAAIRLNHTATHLLHEALKQVVSTQIQQKGSLVDAERARFDFAHFSALTAEEILAVEALVNDKIRENIAVETAIMAIDEAKKAGAVALFGEKYGDSVRVLRVGDFSMELCGGTHARRTGDIGLFKIVAEYGVASGVRRIEMVTGAYALAWINQLQAELQKLASPLKAGLLQVSEKFEQFSEASRKTERELAQLKQQLAEKSGADLVNAVERQGDKGLLIHELAGADGQTLRQTLDQLKSRLSRSLLILYSTEGSKLSVVAGLTKDLLGQAAPAGDWVKQLCGKGGGREDMAQGGGELPTDLAARLQRIREQFFA